MTKDSIVKSIAEDTLMSKCDVEEIINEFLGKIQSALSDGDKVTIKGFGTFSVVERKQKVARNINTGESIVIPAHLEPVFKSANVLKGAVYKTL